MTDIIINTLEKARPVIKEKIKDPEMFQFVKDFIDDFIDSRWPDLIDEVKFII